jgi:hypothetical protein
MDLPLGATTERMTCLRDVTDQINVQNSIYTFHRLVSHKLRTPLATVRSLAGQLFAELELLEGVISIPDEFSEMPLALSEQAVYLVLRELLRTRKSSILSVVHKLRWW